MMRKTPWGAALLDKIEPIERVLWRKSETILFARFTMGLGALLTFLTQLGQIDITPLMPFVPDQYEPYLKFVWNLLPLIVSAGGWIIEQLRKDTTKPLDVVSMRTDAPEEVKIVADEAAALNAMAVVKAKEAGAV